MFPTQLRPRCTTTQLPLPASHHLIQPPPRLHPLRQATTKGNKCNPTLRTICTQRTMTLAMIVVQSLNFFIKVITPFSPQHRQHVPFKVPALGERVQATQGLFPQPLILDLLVVQPSLAPCLDSSLLARLRLMKRSAVGRDGESVQKRLWLKKLLQKWRWDHKTKKHTTSLPLSLSFLPTFSPKYVPPPLPFFLFCIIIILPYIHHHHQILCSSIFSLSKKW